MNLGMVGSVVSLLLQRHNATPAGVARLLDVPDSTITRILRDERGLTVEMLNRICDAIGAPKSEAFAHCLLKMNPNISTDSKEFRNLASALQILERKKGSPAMVTKK